jgi:hypothetical protein
MRRLAILLGTVTTTAGLGVVIPAAPAHAAPYISETVIVDGSQAPVPGNLVGLCLTVRELNSKGCVHI